MSGALDKLRRQLSRAEEILPELEDKLPERMEAIDDAVYGLTTELDNAEEALEDDQDDE